MRRGGFAYVSILLGIMLASLLALTTDQIIQKVYDSGNTAFRVNLVAGGGGGLPAGCSSGSTGVITCADFISNVATNNASFETPNYEFEETTPGAGIDSTLALYHGGTSGSGQDWYNAAHFAGGDFFAPVESNQAYIEFECDNTGISGVFGASGPACWMGDLGTGSNGFFLGSLHGNLNLGAGPTNPRFTVNGTTGNFEAATGGGGIMPKAAAIASAPTCDSSHKGMLATATDCNAGCTEGGTCTTGGSTVCPIYCDGAAWKEL